jgi:hypothetical protein
MDHHLDLEDARAQVVIERRSWSSAFARPACTRDHGQTCLAVEKRWARVEVDITSWKQ